MSKKPADMPDLPPDFPAFVVMPEDNTPQAQVRMVDGQLVLDDPAARGVMMAVGKHNCKRTLELNADRVAHFKGRMEKLGKTSRDTVIVLINVDDIHGRDLAETLMPGAEASGMWQSMRDQQQVPYARGLAGREGIEKCVNLLDADFAGEKMRIMKGIPVVVVDFGTVEVFEA